MTMPELHPLKTNTGMVSLASGHVHSREIQTLHFFNGKYMGYCLK